MCKPTVYVNNISGLQIYSLWIEISLCNKNPLLYWEIIIIVRSYQALNPQYDK